MMCCWIVLLKRVRRIYVKSNPFNVQQKYIYLPTYGLRNSFCTKYFAIHFHCLLVTFLNFYLTYLYYMNVILQQVLWGTSFSSWFAPKILAWLSVPPCLKYSIQGNVQFLPQSWNHALRQCSFNVSLGDWKKKKKNVLSKPLWHKPGTRILVSR